MKLKPRSPYFIVLLSTLVALGPLSTDMYLPALPMMVQMFDSSISLVQLTLSFYLAGFGLFHLACGPLADRFGRKPIFLIGLVIFLLACVACTQASTVNELIFWRFVQGMGACVGPTLGRAVVRDVYEAHTAAKAIATMSAIMAVAPVLAPILGGWMLLIWSWQSTFWFLAAYALLAILALQFLLDESLPSVQSLKPSVILSNYRTLLGDTFFLKHMIASSSLYAGILSYVAGSSFVLIDFLQVPAEQFGLWFSFNVFGFIFGNMFMIRFSTRISAERLILSGGLLSGVAGSVLVLFSYLEIHSPFAIVIPIAFFTFGYGICVPTLTARALQPFAHMAGTASALMGFVQVLFAATGGAVIGFLLEDSPLPMALVIFAFGAISLVTIVSILRAETPPMSSAKSDAG